MFPAKMHRLLVILLALCCVLPIAATSFADIHLITTLSWEYGGYPRGEPIRTEVWLSATDETRMNKNNTVIIHYDKDTKWIIDTKTHTYKESPIEAAGKADKPEEKLHNEGFVYEPEFDWILQEVDEDTVLCGIPCKKFILDGDADYAEKTIEIWASTDIKSGTKVNKKSLHYFQGRETAELIDKFDELKGHFILYEKTITEGAIGPTSVITVEIITLENRAAPEGTYQLPAGLKRRD